MKMKFKPLLSLLFLSISSLSLVSCNEPSFSGKVFIDFGTARLSNIDSITNLPESLYDDIADQVDKKESFMLVIYNEGCECWENFAPVVTEFINETSCNVSYINAYKFIGKDNDFGLKYVSDSKYFANLPSVALFSRGKLVKQVTYKDDTRLMFKYYKNHFEKYWQENIVLPKMYYVEKETLDAYREQNKDFSLYIARSNCDDCKALNRTILSSWSDRTLSVNNPLYIFDIQKYWASERNGDSAEKIQAYQDIKDEYGLSTKYNPVLGYGNSEDGGGAVPTLQKRTGNTITDMCVVLNDKLDKDNKVVDSYFTTERVAAMPFLQNSSLTKVLNGMSLTDDQVTNWRTYRETYYQNYHNPIAQLFVDTYIN